MLGALPLKAENNSDPFLERFTMTIIEKNRTEYKIIDQVLSEVTRVMQKIETLESCEEANRTTIEELHKSGMMYRKVIKNFPHRMCVKDANLSYVFCNEAYAQDLNITPDEISGKSDHEFFSKELAEKIITEENEILSSGVKREVEEKYVVSGQELTVLAIKTPVRNDNDDIIGLQVVLQDITKDRRRAQNHAFQLKNLEDLRVKGDAENDALKIDLERMTAQRNQLEAEIKEMQESMKKQMAIRDAMIEKLKSDLQQETSERNDAVELLRKSFTQIQDLMNSLPHLMGPSRNQFKTAHPFPSTLQQASL
jgi:PAS domain S-box-containing protein